MRICAMALALGVGVAQSQGVALVRLEGDDGEYITQGDSYRLTFTPATSVIYTAQVYRFTNDLRPTYLYFAFAQGHQPYHSTILQFSTDRIGQELVPGRYENATHPQSGVNSPGLSVTLNNRTISNLDGWFEVDRFEWTYNAPGHQGFRIECFKADFAMRQSGGDAWLRGRIDYSTAVPEPASALGLLAGCGLAGLVRRRRASA